MNHATATYAAKKDILRLLSSLPGDIYPLQLRNPSAAVRDNGFEYALLDRSKVRPDELSLFDLHNGPDTNPTECPVSQMEASTLALVLSEVLAAAESLRYSKRQRLLDDMEEIAGAIADEKGQNVPYCASIDLSVFPLVVELLNGPGGEGADTLSTCRFLAANGNKFPEEMKEASLEEFRAYALEHEDEILDDIREDVEYDYEDSVGRKFNR